jgi:hypothetical protein
VSLTDWRIILRWILKKYGMKVWVASFHAHSKDLLDYIIDREFTDQLSNCQLLKINYASWSE